MRGVDLGVWSVAGGNQGRTAGPASRHSGARRPRSGYSRRPDAISGRAGVQTGNPRRAKRSSHVRQSGQIEDYFSHRVVAAFRAISARRSGGIFFARALPPRRPSSAAALAGFSPASSSISPVAILATLPAAPITSALYGADRKSTRLNSSH